MFKFIFLIVIGLIAKSTSNPTFQVTNNLTQVEVGDRILVPLNLTSIKNKLDLESNVELSIENSEVEHSLPFNYIEEDDMGYLITRIDHPSEFKIELNYFLNDKIVLKDNFNYKVVPLPTNFDTSKVRLIDMTFENFKISNYLEKENQLLNFFGKKLANGKILVQNITKIENDLTVQIGADYSLSKGTKIFFQQTCPKLNRIELEFTNSIGFPLKQCSILLSEKSLISTNNYRSNKLTIDFAITSGSTQFSINSILFTIIILLSIFISKK